MKKALLCNLVFLGIFLHINAQSFVKSYDIEWASYGSVISTKDGGYMRAATIYYERRTHLLFVKTNAMGNVQWSKTWGPADGPELSEIIQTSDGGYVVAGAGYNGSKVGMMLLKLNSSGNTQWVKYYTSDTDMRSVLSLVQTPDGGYAFAGVKTKQVLANYQTRACLVRTDSAGNLLWSKLIFKFSPYASIDDIAVTKDGGLMLVGGYSPSKNTALGCYIMKLSGNGTLKWTKIMPRSNQNQLAFIKSLKEGGYLLGGSVYSEKYGSGTLLTKINESGVSVWSKLLKVQDTVPQLDKFLDATEVPNGYVAVGYVLAEGYTPIITRYSKNGKFMGAAYLNVADASYATSISSYTNKGFAVAITVSLNAEKMYLAKFDRLGNFCDSLTNFGLSGDTVTVFENTTVPFNDFSNLQVDSSSLQTVPLSLTATNICNNPAPSIDANDEQQAIASNIKDAGIFLSPNPVINTLYLRWSGINNSTALIEIYSVAGKKLYEKNLNSSKGNNSFSVPVNNLPKGMYFLKLKTASQLKTIKFMKE